MDMGIHTFTDRESAAPRRDRRARPAGAAHGGRVSRRHLVPTTDGRAAEAMPLPVIQVDAFTDRPFAGNPAAVCVLPEEPVRFHTRSGLLVATRRDSWIELDFPAE